MSAHSVLTALGAVLLVAACREQHAVMQPQGPYAAEIAQLAWVLFIGGGVIFAAVIAATWVAMRGPLSWRKLLADRHTVIAGGIAFPIAVLTALLAYNAVWLRAEQAAFTREPVLRLDIVGEQWWWRVAYPGDGGAAIATANEIYIPVGREVELALRSNDVIHSFWVPSLGGKADMIPGRTTRLRLKADRPGVFRGLCAEYCGGPHALMALPVVAIPAVEFQAWSIRESAPAVEPTVETEQRGKSLFIAAGCGGCHAVRGTPAIGTVGPDLTHFGGRRSVGVDTIPVTKSNVVNFIVNGQHVKPGNLMPQFRIFAEHDLDALASYLLMLR